MNAAVMGKLEPEHIQQILVNIYEKCQTNVNLQANEVVVEMVQQLQSIMGKDG